MSRDETDSGVDELTASLARHGIVVDARHVRAAAEWRPAMLDAVAAIRKLDLRGVEPDAVFAPISDAPSARITGGTDD